MSKAADIRAALADGKTLTAEQIAAAVGYELKYAPTAYLSTGTLASERRDGVVHYRLRTTQDAAPAKRPRRLKGFRAEAREKARKARKAGKVKSYKQLRRALKAPARTAIADLARDNYLATQDQLITVIQERVAGLHDDEVIAPLLAAHQRARQLYQAAQS